MTFFDNFTLNNKLKTVSKKATSAMKKAKNALTNYTELANTMLSPSYALFYPTRVFFPIGISGMLWAVNNDEINTATSSGISIVGDNLTDIQITNPGVYFLNLRLNCDVNVVGNVSIYLYMNGSGNDMESGTGTLVEASEKYAEWNNAIEFNGTYMIKTDTTNQICYFVFNNQTNGEWFYANNVMWSRLMIYKVA